MTEKKASTATCCAPGCPNAADVDCFIEDDHYPAPYIEEDFSCPSLCMTHAKQNVLRSIGLGRYQQYPFTKWAGKRTDTGYSTYRDRGTGHFVQLAEPGGLPLFDW